MFPGRRAEILETAGSFNNPESFDFTTPHGRSSSPEDELDFQASFPFCMDRPPSDRQSVGVPLCGPWERLSTFARPLAEQEAWHDTSTPQTPEKPREDAAGRSQALRGKSGPGVPMGYCDFLHFFPKSLLFTLNASAAPACSAPPFSFPICKWG